MKKIALLSCKEIDPNAYLDDDLIFPFLLEKNIFAEFVIWNEEGIDWKQYDAIIIRSTWDYTEHIEQFLEFLRNLPADISLLNSYDIVSKNYTKSYLLDLVQLGFEIVPSIQSEINKESIESAFQKFDSEKILVKPLVGASSIGIKIFERNTPISEISEVMLIQPFLKSIHIDGEISLILFNGKFSHAITKVPKSGDFRSQEEYGSCITAFKPDFETIQYAESISLKFAPTSLFSRIDLLKNEEGLWRFIGEVELIEPALYLNFDPAASENFANAIIKKLNF
ncbi:hypothetical protein A9Q84_16870 [Halobacteriovorax marinus]|uniref:Prokaryotic glutathione synthetase ATP-binding domain-containing protein n=1 Tax=Halobacteriovorax marinus TaxID=97084 RepID=A0A1Y5F523_9BACT|nr:hypothetical protein A9Q84_16870 [Halobacteriovorax marinus]